MLAVKAFELRNNQKKVLDTVADGETVIVSRPQNKNIVIVSQDEYNDLLRLAKIAKRLEAYNRAFHEFGEDKSAMTLD